MDMHKKVFKHRKQIMEFVTGLSKHDAATKLQEAAYAFVLDRMKFSFEIVATIREADKPIERETRRCTVCHKKFKVHPRTSKQVHAHCQRGQKK